MARPYPPRKSAKVTIPSAGAMTACPTLDEISIPLWNAPSPLNGSIRSPNDPVTGPSTGHRLGAELARSQSAVVAFRVSPREMPVAAGELVFFGAQRVVLGHLQQHPQVGAGDPGQAQKPDHRSHHEHVQVVDRNRYFSELPVVAAGYKKYVEAFTQ